MTCLLFRIKVRMFMRFTANNMMQWSLQIVILLVNFCPKLNEFHYKIFITSAIFAIIKITTCHKQWGSTFIILNINICTGSHTFLNKNIRFSLNSLMQNNISVRSCITQLNIMFMHNIKKILRDIFVNR